MATQVYYGVAGNLLIPAPSLSISPEIYYVNDSVVGYTYNITLNGYATALESAASGIDSGLDLVLQSSDTIRQIFNINGKNLTIKDDGAPVLVAKGGTIKSLTFNPSDNKWTNFATYSVELEFNELDFTGCSASTAAATCASSFFHNIYPSGFQCTPDNLIDITKHKIKTFSDKWSFNIENDIYASGPNSADKQESFKVGYTVSATGKNYYVGDLVTPAWEGAKNFVQEKLFTQVKGLISGILIKSNEESDGCDATKKIFETYHTLAPTGVGGLLETFDNVVGSNKFRVYNETISCETSEASGSFSATYSAIIKKYNSEKSSKQNAAIHSYTKSETTSSQSSMSNSIVVQGSVQGLVEGGFIKISSKDFTLQKSGTLLIKLDSDDTKYKNAEYAFKAFVLNPSLDDLKDGLKTDLGLTKGALYIQNNPTAVAIPTSFNIDHSYHGGSISYTATYDTARNRANGLGYSSISITRDDPVDLVQEFIVPGRSNGPIIQKLGSKTAKTMSINIEGNKGLGCKTLEDVCQPTTRWDMLIPGLGDLLTDTEERMLTQKDFRENFTDGSFSISLGFIYISQD